MSHILDLRSKNKLHFSQSSVLINFRGREFESSLVCLYARITTSPPQQQKRLWFSEKEIQNGDEPAVFTF